MQWNGAESFCLCDLLEQVVDFSEKSERLDLLFLFLHACCVRFGKFGECQGKRSCCIRNYQLVLCIGKGGEYEAIDLVHRSLAECQISTPSQIIIHCGHDHSSLLQEDYSRFERGNPAPFR